MVYNYNWGRMASKKEEQFMPELEKYIDVIFDSSSTIKEYALLELFTTEHIVK